MADSDSDTTDRRRSRGIYRVIHVRMWGDRRFRRLSALQPSGQALWLYLLTGPHTGPIPGLFSAGESSMAEALRWPLEAFREAFREAFAEGMVKADWEARLVWVPKAVEYNPPQSPNVVKSWASAWHMLPECDLLVVARARLRAFLEGFGKAFGEAFDEGIPEALGESGAGAGVPPLPPRGGPVPLSKRSQRNGKPKKRRRKSEWDGDLPWDSIVQTWNENAGALARLTLGSPPSDDRESLARRLWLNLQNRTKAEAGDHDDDYALGLMGAGVRRCSEDGHYVQNRHGFDAFCRKADRWLDEPGKAEVFNPDTYRPEDYPPDHPFHVMWAQS